MKIEPLKKLMWAVNLIEPEEPRTQVLSLLRTLSLSLGSEVEGLFVLSPAQARVNPKTYSRWDEAFRTLAEKEWSRIGRMSELPSIKPVHILADHDKTIQQMVRRAVDCVKENRPDAVILSTHARKGVSRLFMGSFAESFLNMSPVPVLIVNPGANVSGRISEILCPTDFGQPSRRSFEDGVALARSLGAKIRLFYKEPNLNLNPYVTAPGVYDYLEIASVQRKGNALAWSEWAKARGVTVDIDLDEKPGNVTDAIVSKAAETKADLVMMCSESGPVSAALLGSVSRGVIRDASCPVLVKHFTS